MMLEAKICYHTYMKTIGLNFDSATRHLTGATYERLA